MLLLTMHPAGVRRQVKQADAWMKINDASAMLALQRTNHTIFIWRSDESGKTMRGFVKKKNGILLKRTKIRKLSLFYFFILQPFWALASELGLYVMLGQGIVYHNYTGKFENFM